MRVDVDGENAEKLDGRDACGGTTRPTLLCGRVKVLAGMLP
jgi:hypothetical protein